MLSTYYPWHLWQCKRVLTENVYIANSISAEPEFRGRKGLYGYLVTDSSGSVLINLLTYRDVASKFHVSTEGQENDLAMTGLEPR